MDVGDWLRSLGLGQYEDVFDDNGVDGAVLPKLTADDLKEMGIAGVGHRRKILSAIAELSGSRAAPSEVAAPVVSPAQTPPSVASSR